ncbi:hypothetical protein FACS189437_03380 [Bacteroidia bacterium]|nr:hypothetical protein FACS189437_03380 [Bacteroidia bacterium]
MLKVKDMCRKIMFYNINALSLYCVFHGIRFKVNKKIGCRDDNLFFLRHSRWIEARIPVLSIKRIIFSLLGFLIRFEWHEYLF